MAQISLFFGSTTGKTAEVAERIQTELGGAGIVNIVEINDVKSDNELISSPNVIIGCPTWDIGELQSDWETFFPNLDNIDFNGKKIAYFGTGDQVGYSDNFMDAMGILEEKISQRGGTTVGYWSTDGYEYDNSRAIRGDKFCGLALDEDNQDDKTDERISEWVAQLKTEFGL